LKLSIG